MTNLSVTSLEKGTYCHLKTGHLYEVIGIAVHSEDSSQLVVYRPLYKTEIELFVRPYEMFAELVSINGSRQPRFKRVQDSHG